MKLFNRIARASRDGIFTAAALLFAASAPGLLAAPPYNYNAGTLGLFISNDDLQAIAGTNIANFSPRAIAVDIDGSILVFMEESTAAGSSSTSGGAGVIIDVDADGVGGSIVITEAQILAGLSTVQTDVDPNGMVVNPDGTIVVGDFDTLNELILINPVGPTATTLAPILGLAWVLPDPANNRVLAWSNDRFGGSDEIIGVALPGGATNIVLDSQVILDFTGFTNTEQDCFVIDPLNPTDLLLYDDGFQGTGNPEQGSSSYLRITNYDSPGTTVSTAFASTYFPSRAGFTAVVADAAGTLFGWNAFPNDFTPPNNSVPADVGLYVMPVGSLSPVLYQQLDFNSTFAITAFAAGGSGQLAIREDAVTATIFIANGGSTGSLSTERGIYTVTFPSPLNDVSSRWAVYE